MTSPSQSRILSDLLTNCTLPTPQEMKETDRCHICNDPFLSSPTDAELPLKLSCGHIWGATCLLKWLSPNTTPLHNTCPLCRSPILKTYTTSPETETDSVSENEEDDPAATDAALLHELLTYDPLTNFPLTIDDLPPPRSGRTVLRWVRSYYLDGRFQQPSIQQRHWTLRAEEYWEKMCRALISAMEDAEHRGLIDYWLHDITPTVVDVLSFGTLGGFLDGLRCRDGKVRHERLVEMVPGEYGTLLAHLRGEEEGVDTDVVMDLEEGGGEEVGRVCG